MGDKTSILEDIRNQKLIPERIMDPGSMFYDDWYLIDTKGNLVGLYATVSGERDMLVYQGKSRELRNQLGRIAEKHSLSYRCLILGDYDKGRIWFRIDGIDSILSFDMNQPVFKSMINPLPESHYPDSGYSRDIEIEK
jgi:hypothetical protein